MRGFIDDAAGARYSLNAELSQSAFVRGFIDDLSYVSPKAVRNASLNPRSCAASSMTWIRPPFMVRRVDVSIRVRARLHR